MAQRSLRFIKRKGVSTMEFSQFLRGIYPFEGIGATFLFLFGVLLTFLFVLG